MNDNEHPNQNNQDDLKFIGRGYRIKDKLGPDFKYFIRGLKEEKGINPHELDSMPSEEYHKHYV